jgi:hypothetical protein
MGSFNHTSALTVYSRDETMPNDIDMRVKIANISVTLFYTKTSGGANSLFREHVNKDFTNSSLRSANIGNN